MAVERAAPFLLLTVALGLGLAACGGPIDTVAPVPAQARIYQTDRLGIGDSLRVVIRDQVAWNEAWARATSGDPAPPEMPRVNFDRFMILLVAAGRMDPGDRIQVDSVGVREEDLMVIVRTTEDCRQFTSDVYPLEIVRVPKSDRRVRWVERRELAPHCRGHAEQPRDESVADPVARDPTVGAPAKTEGGGSGGADDDF